MTRVIISARIPEVTGTVDTMTVAIFGLGCEDVIGPYTLFMATP